jgi:hypothetical protein
MLPRRSSRSTTASMESRMSIPLPNVSRYTISPGVLLAKHGSNAEEVFTVLLCILPIRQPFIVCRYFANVPYQREPFRSWWMGHARALASQETPPNNANDRANTSNYGDSRKVHGQTRGFDASAQAALRCTGYPYKLNTPKGTSVSQGTHRRIVDHGRCYRVRCFT